MFFLTHNDKQDEIKNIILKCFYEEDKDLMKMGAYTLAEMYIVKNRFTEVIENVESLNQEQVKYILENEEISKLIVGLYDEESEEKNEKINAIANECLHIWDLMFEKRIGAARILTSKMLDR